MNDDIIIETLKEIRADQKIIIDKVSKMDRDWEISRNGYAPHEVVELLHFADELKKKEERRDETIRKAIINWVTPILLSAVVMGLYQLYK